MNGYLEGNLDEKDRLLRETERKLNEVPSEMLAIIQGKLVSHSFSQLASALIKCSDFVRRMQEVVKFTKKPIQVRVFKCVDSKLYAAGKIPSEAIEHLRIGDRFQMVRLDDGLETPSGVLEITQPPNRDLDVVWFRLEAFISDELRHVASLAQAQDVVGLKGYRIGMLCNLSSFDGIDLTNAARRSASNCLSKKRVGFTGRHATDLYKGSPG